MKYIDLFAGVGGFSLGIKRATEGNWERVGYYEWDKYAVETYNKNFGTNYEPTDITKVDAKDIPDHDLLCAGFPCQSFSIAGKRGGFEDTRGTMFFEIVRIVRHKRPRLLFLENVKGLLNHDKGKTFATILSTLDELGYDAEWQVLNSKHFGVPQNRERVFIIGHLRGKPTKKVFPIGESSKEINELQGQSEYTNTIQAGIRQDRQGSYIIEGEQPTQKLDYVQYDPNQKGNRSQDYRVYNPDGISETLRSSGADVKIMDLYNNKEHSDRSPTLTEPHHNTLRVREGTQIRRLTPTECERLQGFPDGWTEGVSDTQRYKQMGNAVTTNVIQAIVEKLL